MSGLRLHVARWSRPLVRPIVVGGTPLTRREGMLLALGDARGRYGLGDAAPLPGLSHESIDDVIALIHARGPELLAAIAAAIELAGDAAVVDDVTELPAPLVAALGPSLGQALESALLDLAAVAPSSLRTARLLAEDGSDDARAAGIVKVKVGRGALVEECKRVGRLRDRGVRIRLDGNRQLDVDATHALAAAAGDALEYFEEPTPRHLLGSVHVPLALDETLDETLVALPHDADAGVLHGALKALPSARIWVVKPTVLGPSRTARLFASAPGLGTSIVLSSAYDSSVGRRGLVRLGGKRGLWGSTHGLGTGALLADDLHAPPAVIVKQQGDVIGVGDPLTPGLFADLDWQEIG